MLGAGFIVVDRKPRPCVWCFGMTTNEKTQKKQEEKKMTKIFAALIFNRRTMTV